MIKKYITIVARWSVTHINHLRMHGQNISIIANNCIGADMAKRCNLRYNSPIVNLQILPEDYVDFIENLDLYLGMQLEKVEHLNIEQKKKMIRMFGKEDIGVPLGMLGKKILIVFQHYNSFEDAEINWNRRKERVKGTKKKYVFIVDDRYQEEAKSFDKLKLQKNAVLFTINWKCNTKYVETKYIKKPEGIHFMKYEKILKKYYDQEFDLVKWLKQ